MEPPLPQGETGPRLFTEEEVAVGQEASLEDEEASQEPNPVQGQVTMTLMTLPEEGREEDVEEEEE